MSEVTYAVVFSGGVIEGFAPISVKAHIAKMLKVDATKMASLFSGKAVVIKRTADKTEALRYGGALKKIGADVSVKVIKTAATSPPAAVGSTPVARAPSKPTLAAVEKPQSNPAKAFADFGLAPNEGNLFDPMPAPEPVKVNFSSISLAENDDSPLAVPRAPVSVNVDISSMRITENDGSPLVAPAVPVQKIAAPDFSLDEPGAVLDTIKDDRLRVKPDTSGMSLAFPGADLLNPEERKAAPALAKPDISKIKLEANFDL